MQTGVVPDRNRKSEVLFMLTLISNGTSEEEKVLTGRRCISAQREAEPEVEEKRPDGECVLVDPERGLTAADWERLRDGKLVGLATFDPCIAVPGLEMRERWRGHGDALGVRGVCVCGWVGTNDVLWEHVMQSKQRLGCEGAPRQEQERELLRRFAQRANCRRVSRSEFWLSFNFCPRIFRGGPRVLFVSLIWSL